MNFFILMRERLTCFLLVYRKSQFIFKDNFKVTSFFDLIVYVGVKITFPILDS